MQQFTFPNGVSVDAHADIHVRLHQIASLNVGRILDSVSAHLEGDAGLIVESPSAEQLLGLPDDPLRKRLRDRTFSGEIIWFDTAPRRVSVSVDYPPTDDATEIETMIRSKADAWRSLELESVSFHSHREGDEMELTFIPDERTDLERLALDCMRAIAAVRGTLRPLDSATSALQNLRSLAWEAFHGLHENVWLEVKAKMWGLENESQRFELALDVSSFANSPVGGLIIVGFATKADAFHQDVIVDVQGLSRLQGSVPQVEAIVGQRVFPHLQALTVEVIERDDRSIMVIHVPPQPQGQLPHIVAGSPIDGDKRYGHGFSWVVRRGTSKQAITVAEVQQRLSARSGGELP